MINRIAPDVWVAAPAVGAGVMVIVATCEGKVVVDTSSYPLFARDIREAVDEKESSPWRFVINTHRHFDHVGGNQAFEECVIIAPQPTREIMQTYTTGWMEARFSEWEQRGGFHREWIGPNFRLVLPQVSFMGELELQLGGTTLSLMRLGGHTANNVPSFCPNSVSSSPAIWSSRESLPLSATVIAGSGWEPWRYSSGYDQP